MKNARECYEALLRGDKLRLETMKPKRYIYLNEAGTLVNERGERSIWTFASSEKWSIYQEPRWEDALEDGPVLCWASDGGDDRRERVVRIIRHDRNKEYQYCDTDYIGWRYATPITREEFARYNGRLFPVNAVEGEPS